MLATGLVTSVHCVAMCGTLVLTYTVRDGSEGSWPARIATHAVYQSAKIVSYMAVGLLLGLVGSAVDVGGVRGWVTVSAGLFMVLLGLNLTGSFPWLNALVPRPPKSLKRRAEDEASEDGLHLATPFVFGLLTGFMPCGPLQAAQLYAAGTGTPLRGLVAMLGFGLGTAPLMIAFGTVSSMLTGGFKRRMMYVAAAVVVLLGLVMLNRGALLVGSPVTFQSVQQAFIGGPVAEETTFDRADDGVAEVRLVIRDTRFEPSTLVLPEDEPVRLLVDRREDEACSDRIAVPQMGLLADLVPFGTTVVELPPVRGGTFTLTCGMGMMSGMIVVGDVAAARGPTPAAVLVVAGALVAGAWYLIRRRAPSQRGRATETGRPAAPALVFGFTPVEVLVIVTAVAAAVIAGLLFGGALTY